MHAHAYIHTYTYYIYTLRNDIHKSSNTHNAYIHTIYTHVGTKYTRTQIHITNACTCLYTCVYTYYIYTRRNEIHKNSNTYNECMHMPIYMRIYILHIHT